MAISRTSLSIKNAKFALIFYIINLVLSFFSRKVFIDYLGTEILGLNTTLLNLLGFLNLAELGIGNAISYALYKPLSDKNTKTINEIVSIQGYWYKKIAYLVLISATILMCFFPILFAKTNLSLWYVYLTFIVLLANSLFSYFWNYLQIVLSADQKQYKVTINRQSCIGIKVILQMLAIIYLPNGYIFWLIIEFIFAIIMTTSLSYIIKKEYPWLKPSKELGKKIQNEYPNIISKTKQLFFHRIAGFVLTQTSPIIIYAYTSLTLVAIYGNYLLIVSGITALLGAIFSSINAGVGNLVAQGNKEQINKVFWELFSVRFLFVTSVCYGVYWLTKPFITIWVGETYLLDNLTLTLTISIMYINLMRTVIDSFINAYGLYRDIWATITETFLNLSLSIILGYYFGIHGILTGVLISLFAIVFIWKPYFCYSQGFNINFINYIIGYGKHILVLLIVYLTLNLLTGYTYDFYSFSILKQVIFGIGITVIFVLSMFMGLYYISNGLRNFSKRIINHLR